MPWDHRAFTCKEQHLTDLYDLRELAAASEQFSAAVNAEKLRGLTAGLHIQKVDHQGSVTLQVDGRDITVG